MNYLVKHFHLLRRKNLCVFNFIGQLFVKQSCYFELFGFLAIIVLHISLALLCPGSSPGLLIISKNSSYSTYKNFLNIGKINNNVYTSSN